MKKVLFPILALVLTLALALPMAAVVGAAPDTMYVVSGDAGATVITTVYNKANGVQTTVTPTTPLSPVRAQEPAPYPATYVSEYPGPYEAVDSTWDNGVGKWFQNNAPPVGPAADWIWETETADGPNAYNTTELLYDANAAKWGRAVKMETAFSIPGIPTAAMVHIACDNGYEVWVNSGTHFASPSVKGGPGSGWETSTLKEPYLDTSGWQTVGLHDVSADLVSGSNTLYVLAGNEYYDTDDTQLTAGTMYNNPGAVIFQIDIEYEEGGSQEVPVDIKPTSCPNPLNVKSKGVLPVAILGTGSFDVTQVDPASVLLNGVEPLRWALEDVATPFEPFTGKEDCCECCTTEGPDGFLDLTLKFDTQEIVVALGDVEDGECLVLELTGKLKEEFGGMEFTGEDIVRIIKKGK